MSLLDYLPSRGALQLLVLSILLLLGVNSYLNYRKVLKSVKCVSYGLFQTLPNSLTTFLSYHPGFRLFFSTRGFLGNVFAIISISSVALIRMRPGSAAHPWHINRRKLGDGSQT